MFKTLVTGAALVVVLGAGSATTGHAQTGNIVDTAVAAGSFKTLAKALTAADLRGHADRTWAVHRLRANR